ncbi:MAG: hypothetical protein Faunusvirus6_29 [Faunusvirus sp.]|jgi:ankyrin repeat protein|uniref:Uncharacterized protein n=1 Tax=Faunusvirus sp. TaxID=2487766 RepID=A0A3G4ZZ18_9VIRU|nr:MAG: hypothetical protein Faunusvirus6_29 [Faunusvirus sp.]
MSEDFTDAFYNYCCEYSSNKCIELLEQTKYKYIDVKLEHNETPILSALWRCLDNVAQLLYDHGCDLTVVDGYGFTVLMCASRGNYNFVRTLLENHKNIDVNATSLVRKTALDMALIRSEMDIAILLTKYGADIYNNHNINKDVHDKFRKNVHIIFKKHIIAEIDDPQSVIYRSFQTTYAIGLVDIICDFII